MVGPFLLIDEVGYCGVKGTYQEADDEAGEWYRKTDGNVIPMVVPAVMGAQSPAMFSVLERCLRYLADLNGQSPFDDDSVYGKDMSQRAKGLQRAAYSVVNTVRGGK